MSFGHCYKSPRVWGWSDSITGKALVLRVDNQVQSLAPHIVSRTSPGVIPDTEPRINPKHPRHSPKNKASILVESDYKEEKNR